MALRASGLVTAVVFVSSMVALFASTSNAALGDSPPSRFAGSVTTTSFVNVRSACSLSVLPSSAFSFSVPSRICVICAWPGSGDGSAAVMSELPPSVSVVFVSASALLPQGIKKTIKNTSTNANSVRIHLLCVLALMDCQIMLKLHSCLTAVRNNHVDLCFRQAYCLRSH
ncbi:hypothetical protein SDC9_86617 [bioreactor metagenome]|uniref:Uncharacterized protein n=1 Tax=bioreactor metagenome TaxID=1076179 RepID=A0A644ZGK4_9ZZZZ